LKVLKCYEHNIGLVPNGTSGEILSSFYDDLGAEVMCKAIEITNKAQPDHPWKYLNSILNKWIELKIDTPEKADAYNKDLERRLENAKKKRGSANDDTSGPPAIIGDFY
jgi:DnaD/phage-associated family protein